MNNDTRWIQRFAKYKKAFGSLTADEIYNDIINKYHDAFKELLTSLEKQKEQRNL